MHKAAPISVRCPGQAWRRIEACIAAATAAVLVCWLVSWWALLKPLPAETAAMLGRLLSVVAAAALGLWMLHRRPAFPVQLSWDGEGWLLDGQPVSASLQLATGAGLLLRLRGADGPRWLGISRPEAGAAWHGLRVAVQAHARDGGVSPWFEAAAPGVVPREPDQPPRGA